LSTTFKASMNVSFGTDLLILLLISNITILHIANKFVYKYLAIFNTKAVIIVIAPYSTHVKDHDCTTKIFANVFPYMVN